MSFLGLKFILLFSSLGLTSSLLTFLGSSVWRETTNINILSSSETVGEVNSSRGQQITCIRDDGEEGGIGIPEGIQMSEEMRKRLIGDDGRCLNDWEIDRDDEGEKEDYEGVEGEADLSSS